jgi:NCS1 family nucleobase:cation symporter-1
MNSSLSISTGAINLYNLGYLYGFFSSFVVYSALSIAFPPRSTFAWENRGEEAGSMEKVG